MNFIPVNTPLLDGNEKKYLSECIDTGWISSEGPFVARFEQEMAKYCERKYGVAVCNGTAALEAAMIALNLPKGSEVILPSFTIISCAQAITKAGLIPIVVDCRLDTWNMDVTKIEEKITPNTSAIMVVHIYGLPTDMEPVLELKNRYHLKLIEDAAEAHGQEYNGKKCGSFGDVSIFSFYPNKHITCGEGGMILTDDAEIAERCRLARNLFFQPERRYVHEEIGSNFRMTNMQAAIGCAQLETIERHLERKRHIGERYLERLNGLEGISLPVKSVKYANNLFWVFGIVIKRDIELTNAEICEELKKRGIGTRMFFYPIHKQPVYLSQGMFNDERCINSEFLSEKGFYVPSGLGITDDEIDFVSKNLIDIIMQFV